MYLHKNVALIRCDICQAEGDPIDIGEFGIDRDIMARLDVAARDWSKQWNPDRECNDNLCPSCVAGQLSEK